MMSDCHKIFDFAKNWLKDNGFEGALIIMGRSLGSASALELAATYTDEIDALIIESGFAFSVPLLKLLGIKVEALNLKENETFGNIEKIEKYKGPTLIIHAEFDHIIPFNDGKSLYEGSGAKNKKMLKIPKANHNNIFMYAFDDYMKTVKDLVDSI